MFQPGDVIRFYSPSASKEKFHLCVCAATDTTACCFLFLNSGSGYRGDYVLEDGSIPGLPKSPTGETVVSFSMLIRMSNENLERFKAEKTGDLDAHIAGELLPFARKAQTLNNKDRSIVISGLEFVTEKNA